MEAAICADAGACAPLPSPATFSFANSDFIAESKSDTASKLPAFAPAAPPTCRIDKAELASMRATLAQQLCAGSRKQIIYDGAECP